MAEEKGAEALPDYIAPPLEFQPDAEYPLLFGNFRILGHEHCSTFNNYTLMKGHPTNPLWINEKDAEKRGIKMGDEALVKSPWGHKIMRVLPTEDIKKGVVGCSGGFGHLRGLEGDPKYPQFGGVNTAGIMKANNPDPNGGGPILKYIKVEVEAV